MHPSHEEGRPAHTSSPRSGDDSTGCRSSGLTCWKGGEMSKQDGFGSELTIMVVFWFALAVGLSRGWMAGLAVLVFGIPAVRIISLVVSTSVSAPAQPASPELAAARVRQRLQSLQSETERSTPAAA